LETQPSVYLLVSLLVACLSLLNYCSCEAIHSELQQKKRENEDWPVGGSRNKGSTIDVDKSAQREAFPADICNLRVGKPVGMKVA